MSFKFRKSLLMSMAALGLFTAVGFSAANKADAKSYARVTSNQKMSTDPTTRNVSFTGGNALYTKAGTLRGAKLVASTRTLSTLANSSSSTDNFRAYRVATTNRGSVYYKIVSYDGNYRGWIYGGKSTTSFGGGVKSFTTFSTTNLSTVQQNSLYKISNPGIANDGKTVTYKQPAWTQYKVGRQILDSTPYANATFKVTQVGTRTREGDQWVNIQATDNQYSQANGWILYSGLTVTETPVADNAVRINLVDSSNSNNVVKSVDYAKTGAQKGSRLGTQSGNTWSLATADRTSIQNQINTALTGSGYYLGALTASQASTLAQATFGSSVNISVTKQSPVADNAVRINFVDSQGNFIKSMDYTTSGATKGNPVGTWNGSSWVLADYIRSAISSQATTALAGTGYSLPNNALTDSQASMIASTRYGDTVTVPVNSQNSYSTIQPWVQGNNWLPSIGSSQLNASTSEYTLTNVQIGNSSGSNYTGQQIYTYSQDKSSKGWTDLVANLKNSDLNDVNNKFKSQSQYFYFAPSANMNFGPGTPGSAFSSASVLAAVRSNSSLATLNSPKYPVFTQKGDSYDVTFKNWTYSVSNADSGSYGNAVKVYYKDATTN